MSGRGMCGKGLGKSIGKRHNRPARTKADCMKGISKGEIRRLARRGGVKRISLQMYDITREVLASWLTKIVGDALCFTQHAHRNTQGSETWCPQVHMSDFRSPDMSPVRVHVRAPRVGQHVHVRLWGRGHGHGQVTCLGEHVRTGLDMLSGQWSLPAAKVPSKRRWRCFVARNKRSRVFCLPKLSYEVEQQQKVRGVKLKELVHGRGAEQRSPT